MPVVAASVVVRRYDDVRDALFHPDLSRALDVRSFEDGNPRAGVLSTLHGPGHKLRRRLENPLFRRATLVADEQEHFPRVIDRIADRSATGDRDLLALAGSMAVVLAARRAGIDHDGSEAQLRELFDLGVELAQGAALADTTEDPEHVRRRTEQALERLEDGYVGPSRQRRAALLDEADRGELDPATLPADLLTVALVARRRGELDLDDGLLLREAGLYLHGGSHTSAQTTCNAFAFLLGVEGPARPELLAAAATSITVAQQVVHETLRVIPMTPEIKRRVVADTTVVGHQLKAGDTVVLDVRAANRDPDYYGPDSDRFEPGRALLDGASPWGLSFGAGPHVCIGRSAAGGVPPRTGDVADDASHLHGQVARMVHVLAARGVRCRPGQTPERDGRTTRASRWRAFPVTFEAHADDVVQVAGR